MKSDFNKAIEDSKVVLPDLVGVLVFIALINFAINLLSEQFLVVDPSADLRNKVILNVVLYSRLLLQALVSGIAISVTGRCIRKQEVYLTEVFLHVLKRLWVYIIQFVIIIGLLTGIILLCSPLIIKNIFLIYIPVVLVLLTTLALLPMLMFLQQGVMLDKLGPIKSIKHSFKLGKANYFSLFGLIIVMAVIGFGFVGLSTILPKVIAWLASLLGAGISMIFLTYMTSLYCQIEDKIGDKQAINS